MNKYGIDWKFIIKLIIATICTWCVYQIFFDIYFYLIDIDVIKVGSTYSFIVNVVFEIFTCMFLGKKIFSFVIINEDK